MLIAGFRVFEKPVFGISSAPAPLPFLERCFQLKLLLAVEMGERGRQLFGQVHHH